MTSSKLTKLLQQKPPKIIGGLYAITPDSLDTENLLMKAQSALNGGVQFIQYRNKIADMSLRRKQIKALLDICHQYQAPLIINDYIDMALELDADGVHLGRQDGTVLQAREVLGDKKIIGASCYNRLELAQQAEENGVDYVAFGAFFASTTKPQATTAPLPLLSMARQKLRVPIVAIGGISLANAHKLIAQGAHAVAVCHGLFATQDIQSTAQSFARLFPTATV